MTNAKKRLTEIEITIKQLREQLKNAENEKTKLLTEIHGLNRKVIDAMPARVHNALKLCGIRTDLDLQRFLDGEFKKEDIEFKNSFYTNYSFYREKATTRKMRLMTLRNIGEKIATEAVLIAEKNGL